MPEQPIVGIIMGSQSDWETMRQASEMLKQFGVAHESKIVSAHRTPDLLFDYAEKAAGRGIKVIMLTGDSAATAEAVARQMGIDEIRSNVSPADKHRAIEELKAAGEWSLLDKLPKNTSKVRLRNRCALTGRPRGYVRDFGVCRIKFRDLASEGKIPGVTKSSW